MVREWLGKVLAKLLELDVVNGFDAVSGESDAHHVVGAICVSEAALPAAGKIKIITTALFAVHVPSFYITAYPK